jgi:hypothetical protein
LPEGCSLSEEYSLMWVHSSAGSLGAQHWQHVQCLEGSMNVCSKKGTLKDSSVAAQDASKPWQQQQQPTLHNVSANTASFPIMDMDVFDGHVVLYGPSPQGMPSVQVSTV